MKTKLAQLRANFEKLKTIGQLYEELEAKGITNEKEAEEAQLRYEALKNHALKLLVHSRKIIGTMEKEDVP